MTNNLKENSHFKKSILQYSLIIIMIILSIYIVFYNLSHNYPDKLTNQTLLIWFVPRIISSFIIVFILLGACSLLVINSKNSSLKDFLSIKNYIVLGSVFLAILSSNYLFSVISNSTDLTLNLMHNFSIFIVLILILFLLIGILFLTILGLPKKD